VKGISQCALPAFGQRIFSLFDFLVADDADGQQVQRMNTPVQEYWTEVGK